MEFQKVTVTVSVQVPREEAWRYFTEPEHVVSWNNASSDWHTPKAENDLRVGGTFAYRMEAKDGSARFDFSGIYDEVVLNERIVYTMGDDRTVAVSFVAEGSGTRITETFDAETENAVELQRSGWQAILDNFKVYTEREHWVHALEQEGFNDVRICPIPRNEDLPEHTHDKHTVHIILNGVLEIIDANGRTQYQPGDRVDFPAGTTHKARGMTESGTMVIGVKNA